MRPTRVSPYTMPVLLTIVLLAALLVAAHAGATVPLQEEPAAPNAPATFLINYQGRLINPTTGEPLPDGLYDMTFTLYDRATGGTALWSESGPVNVTNGVFTTILGDAVPLAPAFFIEPFVSTGETIWLGIRVGTDPEMEPRQQLTFVGYAMYANDAHNANLLDGRDSLSFADAAHTHRGEDIVSGTIADVRLASTLTRDNEVMSIVLANDGAGSGLDADRLDGLDSSAFAAASHTHSALPIAFAFIQSNGSKVSGTSNVSSRWDGSRYEITIAGHSYFYSSYTTLVTLVSNCPAAATPRTDSVGGKLLVFIHNSSGASIQCDFQFVTFRP